MRLNHRKMDPQKVGKRIREAKVYLQCVVDLYWVQLQSGGHFLHDHPSSAAS